MKSSTIWLTGLSGSGKSTLALALAAELKSEGLHHCIIDGDQLRRGLSAGLGFSREDRRENIRRAAEVCRILNDAGVIAIAALISPFREDRALAGRIIGPEIFHEVHVAASLQVCESRDPRGLYRRARAGQIPAFTGVSDPYEEPLHPALRLDTQHLSIDACVERLLTLAAGEGQT